MEYEVATFIKKHYLLAQDATVLIGVSGGPDSMALLHYYMSIRKDYNLKLIALSVDHQLRGEEGQADLQYVKHKCDAWNIEFSGVSVDVPAYQKKTQSGTQVAARELRYRFFKEQMEKYQADYLALGHHGDDQVETMLMHLVRTASSSKFSGIPAKRPFAEGFLVRPFLSITKEDITAYCHEHHIIPKIDPSNEETRYTRNFFRRNVIPLLKEKNNNIHTTVQHLNETLHEDEKFLQQEALNVFNQVVDLNENGKSVSIEIDRFKSYPTPLQRRTFHLILNYLYDEFPDNLSYAQEEQFFKLLENEKGNIRIDFPQNLELNKSYQHLMFRFQNQSPQDFSFHEILDIPGTIELPNGSQVSASYIDQSVEKQGIHTYVCAKENIALPLHIRTRQAGDRMTWKGLRGSKKIKDIFIDEKTPLERRNTWPIITDNNGKILWLVGLRKRQSDIQGKKAPFIHLYYEDNA